MLPFHNLTTNQFQNFIESNNSIPPLSKQTFKYVNACSICNRKNKKNGLKYSTCKSIIHKKCTQLKTTELLTIKVQGQKSWECLSCRKLKFPFAVLSNHDIQKDSVNSLFQCKCQTTIPTDIADNKYVLDYFFDEYKENPGNNIIDLNDKELDKHSIQSNFQYYQNLEFHELSKNLKRNKTFSILLTNICSLNAT